jgi:hypothetical protein
MCVCVCPWSPQVRDETLTGALFAVDDDQVFKLVMEKRMVDKRSDEGADITVRW